MWGGLIPEEGEGSKYLVITLKAEKLHSHPTSISLSPICLDSQRNLCQLHFVKCISWKQNQGALRESWECDVHLYENAIVTGQKFSITSNFMKVPPQERPCDLQEKERQWEGRKRWKRRYNLKAASAVESVKKEITKTGFRLVLNLSTRKPETTGNECRKTMLGIGWRSVFSTPGSFPGLSGPPAFQSPCRLMWPHTHILQDNVISMQARVTMSSLIGYKLPRESSVLISPRLSGKEGHTQGGLGSHCQRGQGTEPATSSLHVFAWMINKPFIVLSEFNVI